MFLQKLLVVATVAVGGLIAGCTTVDVATPGQIPTTVSSKWVIRDVVVSVPDELSVSEQNRLAPVADIVWREDPLGDRRAQVGQILEDGIRAGTADMNGSQPVVLRAQLTRFHALSDRARRSTGGVHKVSYYIRPYDAATGRPLAPTSLLHADLKAFGGAAAEAAVARGATQKLRITAQIALVTRTWIGRGTVPDPQALNALKAKAGVSATAGGAASTAASATAAAATGTGATGATAGADVQVVDPVLIDLGLGVPAVPSSTPSIGR
ncbi:DUF6778 family protein [Oceanomicrobium pacificus]|uniref:Uncharacterized protein n=1 Tax=Oceanomicrobium pacificus TaxID=2692916 RepID=A0A6B0TVK5_9RHOB|nr:DUF6778 family protein [Oceanomicrobium pacificus]MXU65805.1 hypothetical protein [Oceanomicrobium pacificus]